MNPDRAYDIIEQVEDLLEDQSDVKDGPDGKPIPNKAMRLLPDVQEVLVWLESL